ncbi:hypothetical protein BDP55DRAFT_241823 [Colletotrichum godetiae]|uniref:Uncharacterized protein n=1 Tax=Colletotrichum godetiae TaxID=1209918 RepID=A0AAJ0AEX3_9PEZI|nr:uncharacterized protein BDP55DRAFT_241823 [Colletotrichum godetiae]KAK1672619.1 hypothetical protein BDP55DRAFT_241823 [Colletotrichum godetiae]
MASVAMFILLDSSCPCYYGDMGDHSPHPMCFPRRRAGTAGPCATIGGIPARCVFLYAFIARIIRAMSSPTSILVQGTVKDQAKAWALTRL